MAKAANVTIITSSGESFETRRSWAQKQVALGLADWDNRGRVRFHPKPEARIVARVETAGRVCIADCVSAFPPEAATPYGSSGGSDGFLSYPQADAGRTLRERYPALAQRGAGLS